MALVVGIRDKVGLVQVQGTAACGIEDFVIPCHAGGNPHQQKHRPGEVTMHILFAEIVQNVRF